MSDTTKQIAIRPRALELMEELWDKHSLEIDITQHGTTKSGLIITEFAYDEEDEILIDWLEHKANALLEREETDAEV